MGRHTLDDMYNYLGPQKQTDNFDIQVSSHKQAYNDRWLHEMYWIRSDCMIGAVAITQNPILSLGLGLALILVSDTINKALLCS